MGKINHETRFQSRKNGGAEGGGQEVQTLRRSPAIQWRETSLHAAHLGDSHRPLTLQFPDLLDEPWYLSYAPLAGVLEEQWGSRITGMERVLGRMNLGSFQTNVAPPP
jgi:hypothetical protein